MIIETKPSKYEYDMIDRSFRHEFGIRHSTFNHKCILQVISKYNLLLLKKLHKIITAIATYKTAYTLVDNASPRQKLMNRLREKAEAISKCSVYFRHLNHAILIETLFENPESFSCFLTVAVPRETATSI